MPLQATWKGIVLAESDETIVVEGNHYFPPQSVKKNLFKKNSKTSTCFWKGQASYYDVEVDGDVNRAAAWYYPNPSEAANNIKNYVAFWNGVSVKKAAENGDQQSEGIVQKIKGIFG